MPISKIKEKIDFYETLFTERYLPLPLQIILNNCSDNEKSAFFMAMMPIFSTYANRVRIHFFYDRSTHNKLSAPVVQCYVFGDSGVGKQDFKDYQSIFAQKLIAMDDQQRDIENEINADNNTKGSNSKKKEMPEIINIVLCEHVSRFQVVQHGLAIKKKFGDTLIQYHFTSEMASILKNTKSDSFDLGEIMLKSYDLGDTIDHDTGNKESVKGVVDVNISSLYTTTPETLDSFFKDKLTNGCLNRAILIPFSPDKNVCNKHDGITAKETDEINTFLDVLLSKVFAPDGSLMPTEILDTEFLDQYVKEFDAQITNIINLPTCHIPLTVNAFAPRASVSAFRIASICLYLFKIEKEYFHTDEKSFLTTDYIKDTVILIYKFASNYILYNTLLRYSKDHDAKMQEENLRQRENNEFLRRSLLEILPNQFSRFRLIQELQKMGQNTDPKVRISKWKSEGKIEELGNGKYKKIIRQINEEEPKSGEDTECIES